MTDVLERVPIVESVEKPYAGQAAKTSLSLRRREDGRLALKHIDDDGKAVETPVQLACCFPWSYPLQYVSLRDDKGHELILLESLEDLEAEQRQFIEAEIGARNFLPRVIAIKSVTDETELFHWRVVTSAGERSFMTRRHERPRRLASGEVLIKDIYNDIYVIAAADDLDAKSLRLLWVYLD